MSFIAVYKDWSKQRINACPKLIRQTNSYGFLAKPKIGSIITIEEVTFSMHVAAGANTRIAQLQLVVTDASGNAAAIARSAGINTGTSATVCTVSGGGMTVSAYVGMLLRYTSGTNIGKVRLITANDATTITTDTFTTAPANLDTFEVVNQLSIVPILPAWRMRRDAAQRTSFNVTHKNLEIELGEGAGVGFITRQGQIGTPTYIEPTEFSISCQIRYGGTGTRSTYQNPQIQPVGSLP